MIDVPAYPVRKFPAGNSRVLFIEFSFIWSNSTHSVITAKALPSNSEGGCSPILKSTFTLTKSDGYRENAVSASFVASPITSLSFSFGLIL